MKKNVLLRTAILVFSISVFFNSGKLSAQSVGTTIYAATENGLSISEDSGMSFTNYTSANGLGSNIVHSVEVSGSVIYAATDNGLSKSNDGGASFTNYTTANGLGSNKVNDVYISGSVIYAATDNGLSISTDGGNSFVNRIPPTGPIINSVAVSGSTIYASTSGGLSVSTDNGNSFSIWIIETGAHNVAFSGSTPFAATSRGIYRFSNGAPASQHPDENIVGGEISSSLTSRVMIYGSTIYALSYDNALYSSSDMGNSFSYVDWQHGHGPNIMDILDVCANGEMIVAATSSGLYVSMDSGAYFSTSPTDSGLGSNTVFRVIIR
jgi:hypothetical protein